MIREGDTISEIAAALGVPRHAVREWIRAQPELRLAVRDAEEGRAAVVEMELYERAMGGDLRAMIRYLERA